MKFYGFKKVTLIDFPENIACTLFTYGCNFRCPFCHNPELVTGKPEDSDSIEEDDLLAFLERRQGRIDGVVFTGGEPLMHGNHLLEVIAKVKRLGFNVKIDTNGSFPEILNKAIKEELVDYVAVDFKCSKDKYNLMKGPEEAFSKFLKTLRFLGKSGIEYEVRTTVVPGIHSINEIKKMFSQINSIPRFAIQNFVPSKCVDEAFDSVESFTSDVLDSMAKAAKKFVGNVEVRNSF